jgi:hypothetical protein
MVLQATDQPVDLPVGTVTSADYLRELTVLVAGQQVSIGPGEH